MENIYLDGDYGEYIKVDGICYKKGDDKQQQPDFIGPPDESGFVSCVDCTDGLTISSSSSSSSSTDVLDLSTSSEDDTQIAEFNGENHYFRIHSDESLSLPSDMNWTYSFWIIRDDSSDGSIISKAHDNVFQYEYSFRISSNKLEVIVKDQEDGSDLVNIISEQDIEVGEIYHFTIVSEEDQVRLYINGIFDSGDSFFSLPIISGSDFSIGNNSTQSTPVDLLSSSSSSGISSSSSHNGSSSSELQDYFTGSIFFVSRWNKPLSVAQIDEIYNNGIPYPCECYSVNLWDSFIACWHLRGDALDSRGDNDLINYNNVPFTRIINQEVCTESISSDLLSSSSQSSGYTLFPSPCYGCGLSGDVHFLYGDPHLLADSPDLASFNVDDNSRDEEIVWLTLYDENFLEEIVIRYRQKDFDYTVGGKAISEITVSSQDFFALYDIEEDQSSFLRNGSSFLGSETVTLGSPPAVRVNITNRDIGPETGCLTDTDAYKCYNIDVHFLDGIYHYTHIGGALYYIWEKASTFPSGPINNASTAGIDGIGSFLNGYEGFNSRTQFETSNGINSTRKVLDIPKMEAISQKMTDLQTTVGYVNFDWDPLMDNQVICEPILCEHPCGTNINDIGAYGVGSGLQDIFDWTAARAVVTDPNTSMFNNPGLLVNYKATFGTSSISRFAELYDLSSYPEYETICLNFSVQGSADGEFYIVYKVGETTGVTNILYDMHTWSILTKIKDEYEDGICNELDATDLPREEKIYVGVIGVPDYHGFGFPTIEGDWRAVPGALRTKT